MKNIFKYSAVALGVISLVVSCDISEYNPNSPGYEKVFGDATNIQYVLNGFYDAFPRATLAYSQDKASDIFPSDQLDARYQSTYDSKVVQTWGEWDRLYQYNYFLTQLNGDACKVRGPVKDNFEAQVRIFRAYLYFSMLRQYGDLPWYDHIISKDDPADEYKERDSRDEVVAHMIEDLDYGIEHITSTSPDATCVSKQVAQFIKMRVCLYEASFRRYNGVSASVTGKPFAHYTVEALYALAAQSAKDIMDSGKYGLIDSYRDLFVSDDLQTREVILGAETDDMIKGSQNTYFCYGSDPKSLTRAFVNTYLMQDGTPYTGRAGYETETFAQEFAGRDPRLEMTVRYPGYSYGELTTPNYTTAPLGYQIRKFCYDTPFQGTSELDDQGKMNDNATPIFRYAEVLLDYAEAKAELGEMTDAIWAQTIGAIRRRAGITGPTLTSVPTKVDTYLQQTFYPGVNDPVILEIRRERAIELCLEGRRNIDIIRWGCGRNISTAPWDGIVIEALDTELDVNGDGTAETYFYSAPLPEGFVRSEGVQYVDVTGRSGLKAVQISGSSRYQLEYEIPRELRDWQDYKILDCIPNLVVSTYEAKGYHITQNPGY